MGLLAAREEAVKNEIGSLSQREIEILLWIASGASNQEISRGLTITESTVRRHIYSIYGKLQVRNRTQAALRAIKLGLAPHPRQWDRPVHDRSRVS